MKAQCYRQLQSRLSDYREKDYELQQWRHKQLDLHGIWTLQIVDKAAAQTQFLTWGFNLPPLFAFLLHS